MIDMGYGYQIQTVFDEQDAKQRSASNNVRLKTQAGENYYLHNIQRLL